MSNIHEKPLSENHGDILIAVVLIIIEIQNLHLRKCKQIQQRLKEFLPI